MFLNIRSEWELVENVCFSLLLIVLFCMKICMSATMFILDIMQIWWPPEVKSSLVIMSFSGRMSVSVEEITELNIVGKFVDQVYDDMKLPENDEDVIFEGDNWIGMNVTILKGVTIGRGCIVAAGAVVNKSTPPYSIVGGIPAKVLKMRFTPEQIEKHEAILYPKNI